MSMRTMGSLVDGGSECHSRAILLPSKVSSPLRLSCCHFRYMQQEVKMSFQQSRDPSRKSSKASLYDEEKDAGHSGRTSTAQSPLPTRPPSPGQKVDGWDGPDDPKIVASASVSTGRKTMLSLFNDLCTHPTLWKLSSAFARLAANLTRAPSATLFCLDMYFESIKFLNHSAISKMILGMITQLWFTFIV